MFSHPSVESIVGRSEVADMEASGSMTGRLWPQSRAASVTMLPTGAQPCHSAPRGRKDTRPQAGHAMGLNVRRSE